MEKPLSQVMESKDTFTRLKVIIYKTPRITTPVVDFAKYLILCNMPEIIAMFPSGDID